MPTWLLNPKVWIGIGAALAIVAAFFFHSRAVSKFGKEQFDKGVKYEQDRITKRVERIRVASEKAASNVRKLAEANLNRIDGSVRVVLVRGPGKAACSSGVSQPTSQPRRSDPAGSAPMVNLPTGEGKPLFGLPTDGAIALAAQHDSCWVKVKAWDDWYRQQSEIWQKSN